MDAEAAYEEAYQRRHGKKPEAEESREVKQRKLENEVDATMAKLRTLGEEFQAKDQAGEMTEELKADFMRRNNTLVEKLHRQQADLAAL